MNKEQMRKWKRNSKVIKLKNDSTIYHTQKEKSH